jgi:hypothetical protein
MMIERSRRIVVHLSSVDLTVSSYFSPTLLTMIGHLQRPMDGNDIAMVALILHLLIVSLA